MIPKARKPAKPPIVKTAELSPCRKYRYNLSRSWGSGKHCAFIMLNPSNADAEHDDPTIGRCISYAQEWGYDGFHVCNLFTFITPYPPVMKKAADPVGPHADINIQRIVAAVHAQGGVCVAAWGNHGTFMGRGAVVLQMFKDWNIPLYAFRVTNKNQPVHPGRQASNAKLIAMS